jgi:UMF1 family MFS transporter
VTDRLLLLRLAPPDRIGEMFGLFGLVGKLSAVVGPILYGTIVLVLEPSLDRGAYQVAILSLLALMVVGVWILRPVPEPPEAAAEIAEPEPAIVLPAGGAP